MNSFSNWLLNEGKEEDLEQTEIPSEEDKEINKPIDDEDKPKDEDVKSEIIDALEDLGDDELEVLLDVIYLIILGEEASEDKEESEALNSEEDNEIQESTIKHLTGAERTQGKMIRRTPKWKKKAKLRYIKNRKCPEGTTWSSKTRSCTKLNLDMSRLQKIISKMKIRD